MKRIAVKTALLTAFILLIAGCGNRTSLPQTQNDQVSNIQLVTDIPIPANATMDNDRSLILADRGYWTGRVVMRFWQSPSDLAAFYQAQMPGFGWEPVMSVTSDTSVLSYLRSDRAATVQIEKSGVMGMTSIVSVIVAPRQSGNGSSGGGYDSPASRSSIRAEPIYPSARR